ncbi:kinase-like domain-containing protein [Rhizophagus irregularis DAOM 181602=DAOM 197198]|nr:kinase-like domain-containing protein [Rhizophagus irregularis DAOM 181602=DAOM 197198]
MSNNSEHEVINNSNEWIEKSIVKKRIKYYDHKHFNNIQEIGFGNFGNVYRTNLNSSHSFLALKSFINFDITAKDIVNEERKLYREVDFHENIIHFYGITTEIQCDNSKKYFLMMGYADSGTLRNYLSERFENLTWNDKLNLAFQLADAISYLHDKEIMHHDLHSNNILVHRNIIKLADFGGQPPFCKELHDVNPSTPEDYVKIYIDCWNNDPDDRPTINQVAATLNAIILKENIQVSIK